MSRCAWLPRPCTGCASSARPVAASWARSARQMLRAARRRTTPVGERAETSPSSPRHQFLRVCLAVDSRRPDDEHVGHHAIASARQGDQDIAERIGSPDFASEMLARSPGPVVGRDQRQCQPSGGDFAVRSAAIVFRRALPACCRRPGTRSCQPTKRASSRGVRAPMSVPPPAACADHQLDRAVAGMTPAPPRQPWRRGAGGCQR